MQYSAIPLVARPALVFEIWIWDLHVNHVSTFAKDEIIVPIALSAFREKGSVTLWSFVKKRKKKKTS